MMSSKNACGEMMEKKITTDNRIDYIVLSVCLAVLFALPYVLNLPGAAPGH